MNTVFLLLAEYGTAQIPLERCAHLFGLSADEAAKRANRHGLPVPAFRLGTQKSPWLVDAAALAHFLDSRRTEAVSVWQRLHGIQPDREQLLPYRGKIWTS